MPGHQNLPLGHQNLSRPGYGGASPTRPEGRAAYYARLPCGEGTLAAKPPARMKAKTGTPGVVEV
jgi:hypothetical protein